MTPRASIYNARLMYIGVALGAGGVAFYIPLVLSEVGQAFSGVWAASILFSTNLGRTLGSHLASRHGFFTDRPLVIVSTILLEGIALFSMVFMREPWAFAAVALAAGLGSGLSFPALKTYLLKLKDLESSRLFAGLSLAIRMGMLLGYLGGAMVTARNMTAVFTAVLVMFVGYAAFMKLAMSDIDANPRSEDATKEESAHAGTPAQASSPKAAVQLNLPSLLGSNLVFWFLAIQPIVALSLYVPAFVPDMSVSTPFWITTLTVLLLQMRVTRMAKSTDRHLGFLLVGYGSLFASFCLMAVAGSRAELVMGASILLAVGQMFYGPSFDVLIATYAKSKNLETGKMMARQHFYQNLGVMGGSLVAGLLFDLGLRWNLPSFNWVALALLAVSTLVILWASAQRRAA